MAERLKLATRIALIRVTDLRVIIVTYVFIYFHKRDLACGASLLLFIDY